MLKCVAIASEGHASLESVLDVSMGFVLRGML